MSSRYALRLALFALAVPHAAAAQDEGSPGAGETIDLTLPAVRSGEAADPDCETDPMQPDTITICGERDESELYMSPLPRAVESDRRIIPGLTDPPCWTRGEKPPQCVRFGSVPPYPPLIDMTAFPEPLTQEEAAAVFAVPAEEREEEVLTGERVPIPFED